MSTHIGAKPGEIAERVLIPGDPLRAKYIAENFLENAKCYNEIRGMYGFTGTYKGVPVSIQGSGMGMPSISIYAHELLAEYGVKKIMRIGTCGCFDGDIHAGQVIFAMACSTDSAINHRTFNADFAACCDAELFMDTYAAAKELGIGVKSANVLSSDSFYQEDPDSWKKWKEYGVYAVEMEGNALYTKAAKFGAQALAIFTVSDNLINNDFMPAEQREKALNDMITIALNGIIKD